jgi:hypothetical protein
MQITVAYYTQTGAKEFYYQGPVAARSALLTAGYVIQLDRDGFIYQNPTTRDIVTLCQETIQQELGQRLRA